MTKAPDVSLFADVSPSEQLDDSQQGERWAMVGATCWDLDSLPTKRSFKDTRRGRKERVARDLATWLGEQRIPNLVVGVIGQLATVLNWSQNEGDEIVPQIGARWKGDGRLEFGGEVYSRGLATSLMAYAGFLSLAAFGVAALVRPLGRCTVFIDNLPLEDSDGRSMKLLEAISRSPAVMAHWNENAGLASGAAFRVSYLGKSPAPDGRHGAKRDHPGLVLADWLAASLRAKYEPAFTPHAREIAAVWEAAVRRMPVKEMNLDDEETQRRVSIFSRQRYEEQERRRV